MGKRPGPLKDFRQRKAKVGKKAVKQANVTKIDLRTKKIGLPTQRLGGSSTSASSDSKPTSSKGVPLAELLTQLHHYNAQSRAAALQGLKDLLSRHPAVASRELGVLLESGCLELLQDKEGDVRSAMLSFAQGLLLGTQVDRPSLSPYARLACTYLSSALSSLDVGVQRDALAFLDVLVSSFGVLLLPHVPLLLASFPTLLAKPPKPLKRKAPASGGKPDASSVWHARLSVLRTLLGLIRLDPSTKATGGVVSALRHGASSDFAAGLMLLRGDDRFADLEGPECGVGLGGVSVVEEGEGLASVAAPLLPHLRNYLLEVVPATPANQSATRTPTQQQQLKGDEGDKGDKDKAGRGKKNKQNKGAAGPVDEPSAMEVVDDGPTDDGPPEAEADVSPSPPTTNTTTDQDGGSTGSGSKKGGAGQGQVVEGVVLEPLGLTLDVAMEVLARCHGLASTPLPRSIGKKGKKKTGATQEGASVSSTLLTSVCALFPLRLTDSSTSDKAAPSSVTLEAVNVALLEVLVESGTPSGRAKSYLLELLQAPVTRSGTGDMTARLLRLLRMLLPRLQLEGGVSASTAEQLLQVFGPVVLSWAPGGPHSRQAVRLLCDLCPGRPSGPALQWLHDAAKLLPDWISPAPSKDGGGVVGSSSNGPSNGRLVLETLLRLCKTHTAPAWLPHALLPLLHHAGSSPPPLLALPQNTRKRVFELLFHCPTLPSPLLDRLGHWLRIPGALDENERGFVLEVLHHRRQLLTPSIYLTLLLSLLQPIDPPAPKRENAPPRTSARSYALSSASLVCRSLVLLPAALSSLLPLLLPPLTSLLTSKQSTHRLAALALLSHLLCPPTDHDQQAVVAVTVTPLPEPLLQPLGEAIAQPCDDDSEGDERINGSLGGQWRLCPFRAALLDRYGRPLADRTLSAVAGLSGGKAAAQAEALVGVAGPLASPEVLKKLLASGKHDGLRKQVQLVLQTGV